ncbi:MAG TPA: trypsin-like peptidase domain-containing protein [Elusimicrobiota bacterium]|nr:trypsin-like peptidase domain-containing protein [Elusimicrobiota bacterium]
MCAGLCAAAPQEPEPSLNSRAAGYQEMFVRVAAAVKPCVVNITTLQDGSDGIFSDDEFDYFPYPEDDFFGAPPSSRRPADPSRRRYQGMGSGVLISTDGYILTNEHVVHGALSMEVTVLSPVEKVYVGRVAGLDSRTDLAVIKINPKEKLPCVELADSDKVRVGDWALAVGSPFGLEQTVTAGIVSAVRQSLTIEGHTYSDLFQTDAAINRGNSGGPLMNLDGRLIGINTAIYAPTGVFSGVGFAIPSNRAREVMTQLIEKGRVVRGWMGVEIIPLDDVLAGQFGVPDARGVVVNDVLPDSPAAAAGLRRGDVLRKFNGQEVLSLESLTAVVGRTPPKTTVEVVFLRDGKTERTGLLTGEMPPDPSDRAVLPPQEAPRRARTPTGTWGGARWGDLTPALARKYALPRDRKGVVALRVEADGLVERIGLLPGDLVVSINRRESPDVETFVRMMNEVSLKEGVLLDVNRRGRWLYLSHREGE